jgi:hypothetical protein
MDFGNRRLTKDSKHMYARAIVFGLPEIIECKVFADCFINIFDA